MQISRHGFKAFFRLAPTRQPRQGYLRGASAQLILAKEGDPRQERLVRPIIDVNLPSTLCH